MKIPQNIALVSESPKVSYADCGDIAAALAKQVQRDYYPIWYRPATVQAFESLTRVPVGYWPIRIVRKLDVAGAAGYHADHLGQPYSLVDDDGDVPLTCSHECLEMITDPQGNRLIAGDAVIAKNVHRVRYLLEVSDPSEAFSYQVNGLNMSDFITPEFYDPVKVDGVRYSFMGVIKEPRTILKGGYISFVDEKDQWWQKTWFSGQKEKTEGPFNWSKGDESLRAMIDRETSARRRKP